MLNIFQYRNGLQILQVASLSLDEMGELQVLTSDGKLYYHNGTIASALITEAGGVVVSNKSFVDNTTFIIDNSDGTIRIGFNASGTTGTTTTIASSQTVNRTITLPDATDTLVGKATSDTLTNKTIDGGSNTITNIGNTSFSTMPAHTFKGNNTGSPSTPLDLTATQLTAELDVFVGDSGSGGTKGLVLAPSAGDAAASKFLKADGTWSTVSGGGVVTDSSPATLSNKNLIDNSTFIVDVGDNTKRINFDAAGTTGTTTVIRSNQSVNRTLDLPDATDTLVGKATSDNLSNKILDPLTVKFQGVSNDAILFSTLDIGSPASAIIRPKVSTLGVATITTPTLTTGTYELLIKDFIQIITNKDIDGGTASNTSRLTLPKNTKANLDALTRKQATIVYATDQSKAYVDNGTQLVPVGSGSGTGGVNFIGLDTSFAFLNSDDVDAENSTGNWATYADSPGVAPVDMTGGSATSLTLSRTTTPGEVLDGQASFKIVKTATNAQGMGVSVVGNIPTGYRGGNIAITMPFKIISGSLASGDLKMYIYDVTNSQVITPFNNDVITGQGLLQAIFTIPSTTAQIRFGFHFASTSATAVTFVWDDVFIGATTNGGILFSPAMTGWNNDLTFTTDNFGTITNSDFRYRRVGDSMEVKYNFRSGVSVAATAAINLPSGYIIDASRISPNALATMLGINFRGSTSTTGNVSADGGAVLFYDGSTNNKIFFSIFMTSNTQFTKNAGTSVVDPANNQLCSGSFTIPILGWNTNLASANSSVFNISQVLSTGTRVTGSAPTQLGQYRSYLRNAGATTFTETNGSPAIIPSITNGIAIYNTSAFGTGDPNNNPSKYEIFVGKNKYPKLEWFASSGKTGFIDVDPWGNASTSVGFAENYDPTTGIYTIVKFTGLGSNLVNGVTGNGNDGGTSPTYLDIIVSENVLTVQVEPRQVLISPEASVSAGGSGSISNFDLTINNVKPNTIIEVSVQPNANSVGATRSFGSGGGGTVDHQTTVTLYRDVNGAGAVAMADFQVHRLDNGAGEYSMIPSSAIRYLDVYPAAGSIRYYMTIASANGVTLNWLEPSIMIVREV